MKTHTYIHLKVLLALLRSSVRIHTYIHTYVCAYIRSYQRFKDEDGEGGGCVVVAFHKMLEEQIQNHRAAIYKVYVCMYETPYRLQW